MGWFFLVVASFGCAGEPEVTTPTLGETVPIVPSRMPADLDVQDANNNLHIAEHDGRLWLAFRTSETHFASSETRLHVVSTDDELTWRTEGSFSLATDLREPHLVSWNGTLKLYFAVLGTDPLDFEPQGMRVSTFESTGVWTDPVDAFLDEFPEGDFLVWRIRELDGVLYAVGYTGGGNIYDFEGNPLVIHWLRSEDGVSWQPAVGSESAVQSGGGSETDFAFLEDGGLVAVTRNESGDETGFGSKICTAPADDLGNWTCDPDPRKYDSPLLFRVDGHVWLVARRNLTEDGHYDLKLDGLELTEQALQYQVAYWQEGKRCAIWEVLPEERRVEWVADLPSNGDTCFPARTTFGGRDGIYNYSNDPGLDDLAWMEGQLEPTNIYRTEVVWP